MPSNETVISLTRGNESLPDGGSSVYFHWMPRSAAGAINILDRAVIGTSSAKRASAPAGYVSGTNFEVAQGLRQDVAGYWNTMIWSVRDGSFIRIDLSIRNTFPTPVDRYIGVIKVNVLAPITRLTYVPHASVEGRVGAPSSVVLAEGRFNLTEISQCTDIQRTGLEVSYRPINLLTHSRVSLYTEEGTARNAPEIKDVRGDDGVERRITKAVIQRRLEL